MIEAPLRRREIVEILYSANGKVKINDLVARFGVERRTIRRDVEKLSLIYPIASQPGRHGGVYINSPIRSAPRYLHPEEAEALIRIMRLIPENEQIYIRTILRDLAHIDDLTDDFPHTFYKEVVSKVILYRDTHVEFKLQNGEIV